MNSHHLCDTEGVAEVVEGVVPKNSKKMKKIKMASNFQKNLSSLEMSDL